MLIDNNSIELSNQIGNGSYGAVFLGKDKNTDKLYAVKKVSKKLLLSNSTIAYLNNEIYILKHLNAHPNIVKFHKITETISNYYIILEYCNGGNLEQALAKYQSFYKKPFTEDIARYITKSIVTGLAFLNTNNIIHRDIKVENILLNYPHSEDLLTSNILEAQVKIIDFGFARYLEQNEMASTILGTPLFMDPKMISAASHKNKEKENAATNNGKIINNHRENKNGNNHLYNNKADIWSLGVIVYRMLMGLLPFSGKSWNDLFSSIKDRMFVLPYNRSKLELTRGAIKFIDKLLNIDMNKRPTAKELMKDNWLNNSLVNEDKTIMVIKSESEMSQEKEAKLLLFENYWKAKNEAQPQLAAVVHGNTINKTSQIKENTQYRFLLIDGLLERLTKNGNHNNRILTDSLNNEHHDKVISNRYLSPVNAKSSNNRNNNDDLGTPIKEDNHIYSYSKHVKYHK